ncbi:cytokine-dependent hematopoietic cell linker [Denticeps clupeoides]|uniref:cytokine-dependent hematopoietic cell linker n=1 Tax=Denticeps clupeoides TaxID=299321 RepID=UPI0010A33F25|nr:cytokine-dependent hematopoietic cell linker [Denticeps clupeoides]
MAHKHQDPRGERSRHRHDPPEALDEDEYHIPDGGCDGESALIQPARPSCSQSEYVDRSRPRMARGFYAVDCNLSKALPSIPIRANQGPAVNRNLKPGRQARGRTGPADEKPHGKKSENQTFRTPPRPRKNIPVQPGQQVTAAGRRPPRPATPTLFATETRDANTRPSWAEKQLNAKSNRASHESRNGRSHPNHRYSLDLESQELMEASHSHRKESTADMHNEWPQVKADMEHRSYRPQERPIETSDRADWYVGAFARVEAEHALHLVNTEGAFLVRDCSKSTAREPYVLVVFYDNRVFNIQIRFDQSTQKYSLGTGLRTHDTFDSVADIIKFHSIFPVILIDGRNPRNDQQKRNCVLMYPVTRKDMFHLLLSQEPSHLMGHSE